MKICLSAALKSPYGKDLGVLPYAVSICSERGLHHENKCSVQSSGDAGQKPLANISVNTSVLFINRLFPPCGMSDMIKDCTIVLHT